MSNTFPSLYTGKLSRLITNNRVLSGEIPPDGYIDVYQTSFLDFIFPQGEIAASPNLDNFIPVIEPFTTTIDGFS